MKIFAAAGLAAVLLANAALADTPAYRALMDDDSFMHQKSKMVLMDRCVQSQPGAGVDWDQVAACLEGSAYIVHWEWLGCLGGAMIAMEEQLRGLDGWAREPGLKIRRDLVRPAMADCARILRERPVS